MINFLDVVNAPPTIGETVTSSLLLFLMSFVISFSIGMIVVLILKAIKNNK